MPSAEALHPEPDGSQPTQIAAPVGAIPDLVPGGGQRPVAEAAGDNRGEERGEGELVDVEDVEWSAPEQAEAGDAKHDRLPDGAAPAGGVHPDFGGDGVQDDPIALDLRLGLGPPVHGVDPDP